jgi:hypothetical protein
MLALGAVMALEKNLAGGWFAKHLGAMIGVGLLGVASVITMSHLPL